MDIGIQLCFSTGIESHSSDCNVQFTDESYSVAKGVDEIIFVDNMEWIIVSIIVDWNIN